MSVSIRLERAALHTRGHASITMIAQIHLEHAHVPRAWVREAASAVAGGSTSDAAIPQTRFVARQVGETRSPLRSQFHRHREWPWHTLRGLSRGDGKSRHSHTATALVHRTTRR